MTDAEARVPNGRVRAYALWEGWRSYDRKKYTAMLREAFEPLTKPLGVSSGSFPNDKFHGGPSMSNLLSRHQ